MRFALCQVFYSALCHNFNEVYYDWENAKKNENGIRNESS